MVGNPSSAAAHRHRVLIGLPETSRHGKRMSRIDQVYIRIGRVDNAAVIIPGNAGGIGKAGAELQLRRAEDISITSAKVTRSN